MLPPGLDEFESVRLKVLVLNNFFSVPKKIRLLNLK